MKMFVHEAATSVDRNRDIGRFHKLVRESLGSESGALDALLFVKNGNSRGVGFLAALSDEREDLSGEVALPS